MDELDRDAVLVDERHDVILVRGWLQQDLLSVDGPLDIVYNKTDMGRCLDQLMKFVARFEHDPFDPVRVLFVIGALPLVLGVVDHSLVLMPHGDAEMVEFVFHSPSHSPIGRIPQECYDPEAMKTRFRFQLLQPGQKELLLKWLEQPHIREWLHGKGLANLLKNLDDFFAGKTEGRHWIGYEGTVPFSDLLTSPEGEDGSTLDLFMCDPAFRGRGLSV